MTSRPAPTPPPPAHLLTGAALFLDFDGTLVELAATPDAVAVDARLRALMTQLAAQLDGRLAVISGRSAQAIRALFGEPPFPVAGSHGLELSWPDGRGAAPSRPAAMDAVTAAMHALAHEHAGVVVEEKPLGVALHYRQAPAAAAACHALAERLAAAHGLALQTGKMMVELRPGGADKGAALAALMADPAMAGGRPLFLGDDDTDEPAFEAAARLGGAGVLVGPARPTAARYRLENVAAVLDWLSQEGGAR